MKLQALTAGDIADRRPADLVRPGDARADGEDRRGHKAGSDDRIGKLDEHVCPRC